MALSSSGSAAMGAELGVITYGRLGPHGGPRRATESIEVVELEELGGS